MMSMTLLGTALLVMFVYYWVVCPFFDLNDATLAGLDDSQRLLDHKDRCLQVLRDLDLDRATLKISEADYQAMRATISQELAAILGQIDGGK